MSKAGFADDFHHRRRRGEKKGQKSKEIRQKIMQIKY